MIVNQEYIVTKTKTLGDVEMRHLTMGDSIEISHLFATQGIDDREFVLRTLQRQLVSPTISLSEFRNTDDADLGKLTEALVSNEAHVFQYYKNTDNLYADFRKALNEYQLQQMKKLLSLSPGMAAAFKKTNALNSTITTMAQQAIGRFQEMFKQFQRDSQKFEALLKVNVDLPRVATLTITPALDLARKQLEGFNKQFGSIAQQALDNNRNVIQAALGNVPILQKKLVKIKAELAMPYLGVAEQYSKMAQMAMSQLKPQIEFFQDWIARNQRVFDPIWKSWDDIEKKNKIQEKKAAKILRKYKWFICPSMPVSAIRTILEVAKKKGRKDGEINRLFLDYFSRDRWKNLEDMVAAWGKNPLFKARMPIIKNCVKTIQGADKNGSNAAIVVLPTLISQIDGLLTDFLIKKGIPFRTMYDDFVQGGKVKKVGRKTQFKANVPNALTDDLNDLAIDMFLNVLFQSSQRGTPLATPFNFNRHKIMHGESVRFGRKDYVIRAFMVLDFLAHLK
jgi:hypothetical protein